MFGSSASAIARQPNLSSGIQEAVAGVIGSTPEGRAWALAALHPCGAGEVVARNVGALNGMCDTMTSSVATPVYRGETHITYMPTLFNFPDEPAAATTYGIDIIVPPIPEIDFMYRLIDDANNVRTGWIVVRLPDFDLPDYQQTGTYFDRYYDERTTYTTMSSVGYGKIRQIGVGHTFELDAAGLNDQGRVVVGQMEGQWTQVSLTSPHIDVTTGKFLTSTDPVATGDAVTSLKAYGADATSNVWLLEVPTDPATVVSNCPNAYQGLAKHGAYVVQKFTSPLLGYAFKRTGSPTNFGTAEYVPPISPGPNVLPYLPSTGLAVDTSDGAASHLYKADDFYIFSKDSSPNRTKQCSAFGDGLFPLAEPTKGATVDNAVPMRKVHPGISEPSDMMVSSVMFRNLPAGGTNGITSSLRIKSRNYYEAISNGTNAAVAPYIHPPAQFDFQALNSVIIAGKQLADGYPASANSLSGILRDVWGALKQYVKPLAHTLGELDIPFASGFGRMIDKGIGYGQTFENNLAKRGYGPSLL